MLRTGVFKMTTMGERIKYLRGIKGITQEILANEIKCDRSSLSKWENGLTFPPAEVVLELANYFGVSTDFLYCRQTEVAEEESFLYGLNPEAKKRVIKYANYERLYQNIPEDERADSSGLTNTDKEGKKPQLKRGYPGKKGKNRKTGS